MKTTIFAAVLFFFCTFSSYGQRMSDYPYYDYFEKVSISDTFNVVIDTSYKSNIWQIGKPSKTLFNKAATLPNALVTDTLNTYPKNNKSTFSFNNNHIRGWEGITAIQWKQKLDMEHQRDGGVVEFTLDGGSTWENVYNNPKVYKYYGFDSANIDTIKLDYAFSGTDTTWRDIWLCFDNSYLYNFLTQVEFRFTFKSDSNETHQEGWMIDNMIEHTTNLHTAVPKSEQKEEYLRVYPTPTCGRLNIEAQRLDQYHVIESMQLMDATGKVIENFGLCPIRYYINMEKYSTGVYYLQVNTNLKSETFKVIRN